MANSQNASPQKRAYFASDDIGVPGLRQFRERTVDLVDVALPGSIDDFRVTTRNVHLGTAALLEGQQSTVRLERSAKHIALGGLDHYQVVMYLAGETHYKAGRCDLDMQAGDICLMDMAGANLTHVNGALDTGKAHFLSMVMPRSLLAPLLKAPDALQATLIRRDTPYGRLVRKHFLGIRNEAPRLTQGEIEAAITAFAHLVAGGVGSRADMQEQVAQATHGAMLKTIKDYIEENLTAADLNAGGLCRRFGLSRASLYRLFEPDGGLGRFLLMRRLDCAFKILISPAAQRSRIIDIAMECCFSSDATFNRAFRQHYGVTPGEVRARAQRQGGDYSKNTVAESNQWWQQLGRS
jgi:AraC-like DNA-binding protein